ncbi:MAG: hypothetical protein ACYDEV_14855, partial [Acidiferrobacter sp.]
RIVESPVYVEIPSVGNRGDRDHRPLVVGASSQIGDTPKRGSYLYSLFGLGSVVFAIVPIATRSVAPLVSPMLCDLLFSMPG